MTIDPEQWRLNHYFTASASVQRKLPQEDLGDQQTKADFLRKMVAQHGYLHPNFTGKRCVVAEHAWPYLPIACGRAVLF